MPEILCICLFSFMIILTSLLDIPLLCALLAGYVVFFCYGLWKEYTVSNMISFSLAGVMIARNVMIQLVIIGAMTGIWRASGTIAYIVCSSYHLFTPMAITLISFFLCAIVSTLTGSAMGTGATVGIICATMAVSMGVDPALIGGAILSGSAVGDRCSPVSGPALLVASITETEIYSNCRMMVRTALAPFLLTALIYLIVGRGSSSFSPVSSPVEVFLKNYNTNILMLLPALVIVVLVAFRVRVRVAMAASVSTAVAVGALVQHMGAGEIVSAMLIGFRPEDPELSHLIAGGGVLSMSRIIGIIFISSTFSGMFRGTGFLSGVKKHVRELAERTNSYFASLVTSIVTSMIGCNQTLAVMLENDVCSDIVPDGSERALFLADTATLISELIPWSIAGSAILLFVGAPISGLLFAFYNFLVPLCTLLASLLGRGLFAWYIGLGKRSGKLS